VTSNPIYKDLEQRIRVILEEELIKGKWAEEELRESENKYRDLYDFLPISFIEIDTKGTIISFNRKSLEVFRYKREDFKEGMTALQFLEPSQLERVGVNLQRVLDGTSIPGQEFLFLRKDGSTFPGLIFASTIIQANKIVGIRAAIIDITKRKQAEETLRKSEAELRLLIETLPLAVFVDIQGKIVYVNPAFLTLLKASSPDEVSGMRLIEFVSPELFDTIEKRSRIMTEQKLILPPLELILRCLDGTFITVVSTPMPIVFQEQPAILTALYDITERKRNEIELQKAHKLLQINIREIVDLQGKIKEQATRDALTGLFNRHYLEETLEREVARASREGFPIGVVMIDIDHFKQVNDTHGHKAGDLLLQALGNLLLGRIRAGDIACRYGGDEFLLILPQASKAITAERAEQWRTGFEALRTVYGEKALQATISLGVAVYPSDDVTAEGVIYAADQAMYRAKALGRNRVVLS
jgi:diguanylate cyclase (GGDEF)-like protein/PAS domain S-box-containing protein